MSVCCHAPDIENRHELNLSDVTRLKLNQLRRPLMRIKTTAAPKTAATARQISVDTSSRK